MLTPKVCWSCVYLKSWFCVTAGTESFLSSITIRIPLRSDSSRRSETPSIFLSRTASAMRSMSFDLLTWYGISVTIIACRPGRTSSSNILARITTRPRPVRYACWTPAMP